MLNVKYHNSMKRITNNLLPFLIFFISTVASYFIGLLFYDSTSGLDFNTYFEHIKFHLGQDVEIYGAVSIITYFISQIFTMIFRTLSLL